MFVLARLLLLPLSETSRLARELEVQSRRHCCGLQARRAAEWRPSTQQRRFRLSVYITLITTLRFSQLTHKRSVYTLSVHLLLLVAFLHMLLLDSIIGGIACDCGDTAYIIQKTKQKTNISIIIDRWIDALVYKHYGRLPVSGQHCLFYS